MKIRYIFLGLFVLFLIPHCKAAYTYSGSFINITDNITSMRGFAYNTSEDFLWVLDYNGSKSNIEKFYGNGTHISTECPDVTGGSNVWGLSDYGNLLYYTYNSGSDVTRGVYKVDKSDCSNSRVLAIPDYGSNFRGVAYNGSDHWVAEISYDIIYHYDSGGTNIENLTTNSSCYYYDDSVPFNYTLINPTYLTYDQPENVFWVLNQNNGVFKMSKDGTCSYRVNVSEIDYDEAGISMNGTDMWVGEGDAAPANRVIHIYNYANSNPSIDSNSTSEATPRYGSSINITATVTDSDGSVLYVNFTLISSNGTKVIDNVTGTQNGDIWNSTTYTIDGYGTWYWWVNATDDDGGTNNTEGSFSISLGTLTVTTPDGDQNWSISNTTDTNSTLNLSFSHDGNSNNTVEFDVYEDLANSSRFLVYFEEEPSTIQYGVTKNVSVTIQVNDSLTYGIYEGNITVNRTDDSSYYNISINISVEYGVSDILESSFTKSVQQSGTTIEDFQVNNTGNFDLSACNLTFSSTLVSSSSWNRTNFAIAQATVLDVQLSVTAGATAGSDNSATVLLNCTSYSDGSYSSETITGTFTVTSTPSQPSGGGGGGGDGGVEYIIVDIANFTLGVSPEFISLLYSPGENYSRFIDVKNTKPDYVDVTAFVACSKTGNTTEDPSCEWVKFRDSETNNLVDEVTIKIPPGTERLPTRASIEINVQIPQNISYQEYKALIQLEAEGAQATVPLTFKTWLAIGGIWAFLASSFWGILSIPILPEFARGLPIIGQNLLLMHAVLMAVGIGGTVYMVRRLRERKRIY
jgi:hypothetical protein